MSKSYVKIYSNNRQFINLLFKKEKNGITRI